MYDILKRLKVYTFIRNTYNKEYEKEYTEGGHWHDFYQLVYAQKGSGTVVLEDEEVLLSQNDLVIIAPKCRHYFKANSDRFKTYEIKFNILSKIVWENYIQD